MHLEVGAVLLRVRDELGIPTIFKASFDKANRCRAAAARGPGLQLGLPLLKRLKRQTGLPILTDIHEPEQAQRVVEVCDVLQIPAALCRQTDLLYAAAETGYPVNLKKGQWVSVEEMEGAVDKVRRHSAPAIPGVAVTERGTFFGYGDLVADMRNIQKIQETCCTPAIFDATHSVQRPGRGGASSSSGDSQYIASLARAAVASGANGLYLEVHPQPSLAPSDGACMLSLEELLPLMRQVAAIKEVLQSA